MSDWQPVASLDMLVARAGLNSRIRNFFSNRGVLEVETPLLSHAIGTDPTLDPVTASFRVFPAGQAQRMFLQTSPEFAMKRLLAAGTGAIYQLCKAFRNGESGSRHNPEFTMLEWYRPQWSLEQLMDEVEALLKDTTTIAHVQRVSYAELFIKYLNVDPHSASLDALQSRLGKELELSEQTPDRHTCLELLFSHVVEPQLQEAVFIVDYPQCLAALAKIRPNVQGQLVARRFELIVRGMEIANGYDELLDADEQRRRFAADLALRQERGLDAMPQDERMLAALNSGLPPCAGVALGVDRLLMLATNAKKLDDVLGFPHHLA